MAGAPLPNTACSRVTTFSGDVDLACNSLSNLGPQTDCVEILSVVDSAEIDWTVAPVYYLQVETDSTLTFAWQTLSPDVRNQTGVMYLEPTIIGPITITWPPEVMWPGGVAPTMPLLAGTYNQFVFQTFDDGNLVYGNVVGLEYQ